MKYIKCKNFLEPAFPLNQTRSLPGPLTRGEMKSETLSKEDLLNRRHRSTIVLDKEIYRSKGSIRMGCSCGMEDCDCPEMAAFKIKTEASDIPPAPKLSRRLSSKRDSLDIIRPRIRSIIYVSPQANVFTSSETDQPDSQSKFLFKYRYIAVSQCTKRRFLRSDVVLLCFLSKPLTIKPLLNQKKLSEILTITCCISSKTDRLKCLNECKRFFNFESVVSETLNKRTLGNNDMKKISF